ncbi:MAG: substrate-binding domain-containing protein, partial [Verrucomicrobia bacterium]|nr:substrate-binding domain-containing protein [Verrucomicrobiota bacterium]
RLRVPEDVGVVGGTGLDLSETACPMLTRVRQPLEEMGEALARMLSERIRRKAESLPGVILPTRFIGGVTTLPVENEELGIQPTQL